MCLVNVTLITFIIINVTLAQELHDLISQKKCRERNRLINTDKYDLYSLVEAPIGEKLMLQCHYWYKSSNAINYILLKIDLILVVLKKMINNRKIGIE